jgi:hypothetical protein
MNRLTLVSVMASVLLSLSACNRAASPEKVQQDVAKASEAAAESDAKATEKLAAADNAADHDMANAEQKADSKAADAAVSAIITEAEGDRKVAYAKCESLAGTAQRDCRRNADAEFETVKAKIKALKSGPG